MTINFTRRRKFGYYQKGVYPPEFNNVFKQDIRERDGNKCSICGKKKPLDVHHIDYTKHTTRENCISLCRDCHDIVHNGTFAEKTEWRFKLTMLVLQREKVFCHAHKPCC